VNDNNYSIDIWAFRIFIIGIIRCFLQYAIMDIYLMFASFLCNYIFCKLRVQIKENYINIVFSKFHSSFCNLWMKRYQRRLECCLW